MSEYKKFNQDTGYLGADRDELRELLNDRDTELSRLTEKVARLESENARLKGDHDNVCVLLDEAQAALDDVVFGEALQQEVIAGLRAECERLRQLIKDIADMAHDGFNHWNEDRDTKAGKCLLALSGDLPNYNDTAAKITMHVAQLTKEPKP